MRIEVYFVDPDILPTGQDFTIAKMDDGGRAVFVRDGAGPETWRSVLAAYDASRN